MNPPLNVVLQAMLHNFLMEKLFHGSKEVPHIGRAYFHQSIALVSICRQVVPHVGLDLDRENQLEQAIELLNKALEYARKAGRQENTEAQEALNTASLRIVKYLRVYHDHPTQPDKVMGDINKLLIGSQTDTDAHAEGKVKNQVAVAKERLDEMRKKDQDASQQIQHLSERLRFKLLSLSARKKKVEVWVWPAEVNLNQSGVRRREVVLEEDAILDHVLCRVLDFAANDKLTLSLTLNPQFYKTFLSLNKPLPSKIEPLQPSTMLSDLRPSTTLSNDPLVLNLVVDRQWRVVLDLANQVQVFGNVIKVRDDVVFLKNKLGALESARELFSNGELVSFYSYPLEVTMQVDVEWFSVVTKAAEMDESCDFLVSQRLPNESTFKTLDWKPINRSLHQRPPNESTSDSNRSPHTDVVSKKKRNPEGKLQTVAHEIDYIGANMGPISQNFQREQAQQKKGWFKRIFG